MKYEVHYNIVGNATAKVEADSLEQAKKKAEDIDIIDGSENLIEWVFEEYLEYCKNFKVENRVVVLIEKQAADKLAEALRIVEFNMDLRENFQDADWKDIVRQALEDYRGENDMD